MDELLALREISNFLIAETDTSFLRYLHDQIDWNDRLIGIKGARGIGKTTLLLQHIKLHHQLSDTLYVVADHFFFSEHRLYDLAQRFANEGGKYLFIDEIHKYPEWSRELKLIYDLRPDLHIVFTGSSMLDIERGEEADLSRRAIMYDMNGLSFREYMAMRYDIHLPVLSISQILSHDIQLPRHFLPLAYFHDYLSRGYYPFAVQNNYPIRLSQVIQQTIEVDIPYFARMNVSTASKLKHLLVIISREVPFKPNYQKISQLLDVNRAQVKDYMLYLEKAGLIGQLRDATGGIRSLGKVNKIYLNNTALAYHLSGGNPDIGSLRETFFYSQLRMVSEVLSSPVSDFQINDLTFEVGGWKKGQKQIEDVTHGYIVKDDINTGHANIIPLWLFGLVY